MNSKVAFKELINYIPREKNINSEYNKKIDSLIKQVDKGLNTYIICSGKRGGGKLNNQYLRQLAAAYQTKYGDLLIKLKTWYDLLNCSGIDSKSLVKNEIEKILVEEQEIKRKQDDHS